jgi:hypothetical protein
MERLDPASRPKFCLDQPLMWRQPGAVQFDTGEHRILLDHVSAADVRWLTRLDGLKTWATITAGEITNGQRRLLDAAVLAGAIEDAGRVPDSWRVMPAERRQQHEGDLAATRLTYRGIERPLHAIERRLTLRVRLMGTGPMHDACAALVAISGFSLVDENPDIVIIAGGFHPDAAFAHSALNDPAVSTRPHVPVSAYGDVGVVGPIVIPGDTSCLMCQQRHFRDGDPAWPVLVTQRMALATRIQQWPIDRVHAHALAGHALLLVRTWRESPKATHLWANRALFMWLPDGSIDELPRPIHPLCGCTWSPMSAAAGHT